MDYKYKFVKVSNIEWNVDDEEVKLPTETRMLVDNVEDVANALSESYGWCVKSYNVEETDFTPTDIKMMQEQCEQFDYYKIVEVVERITNVETDCGLWQNSVGIIANVKKAREIMKSLTPICEGKYWLIFRQEDITDEIMNELECSDLWLIDYITESFFEEQGIM